MPTFMIETAVTEVSRERLAGVMREIRTVAVEGRAAVGGRNRARFVFGGHREGVAVGYIVREGAAVVLTGWLPAAAYEGFRAALADGGPLRVVYETREGETGYLRRLGLERAGRPLAAASGGRPGSAGFAMSM